ncbi:MAG TPA: hypothetical protein VEW28_10085 [Candidatus Kapabacteria bacterium]|nr:hypothetical protein [Candidatus Kapabacteria bacterium]
MARRYLFILATILFCSVSRSFAAGAKVDSVYADSIYQNGKLGVTSPLKAFGRPDKQYAQLSGTASEFDIAFRRHRTGLPDSVIPIKANASVIIWGKKDLAVDSSALEVIFIETDPGGSILYQSDPFYISDSGGTITVPNQEYTYLILTLPGVGLGTPKYAKSYFIDAIALVEDTSQAKGAVAPNPDQISLGLEASYPNPFSGATNVDFTLASSGIVEIAAVDAVGTEHERVSLGYVSEGSHSVRIALGDCGMYFLRLYLNGTAFGRSIKVISE